MNVFAVLPPEHNPVLDALIEEAEYINRDIRDLKSDIQGIKDKELAELKDSLRKQDAKISGIDKKVSAAMAVLALFGALLGPLITFLIGKFLGGR